MKRIVFVLLSLTLLLSFSACKLEENVEYSGLSEDVSAASVQMQSTVTTNTTTTTIQTTTVVSTTPASKAATTPTTIANVGVYTVTFDLDYDGRTFVAQSKNHKVAKPEDPVRVGYVFQGWYPKNENIAWFFAGHMVTEDITLVARWKKIPSEEIDISTIFATTTLETITTMTTGKYDSLEGWSPLKPVK